MDAVTTTMLERLMITACVPLLIFIGYRLFVMGARGEIDFRSKRDAETFAFRNLSPGAVCLLAALMLAVWVMNSHVDSLQSQLQPRFQLSASPVDATAFR